MLAVRATGMATNDREGERRKHEVRIFSYLPKCCQPAGAKGDVCLQRMMHGLKVRSCEASQKLF